MTVHFDSKDRPLSFWTVYFGSNDRPVWLKTVHFWTDRPLSRDRPLSPFWTRLRLIMNLLKAMTLSNFSDNFPTSARTFQLQLNFPTSEEAFQLHSVLSNFARFFNLT